MKITYVFHIYRHLFLSLLLWKLSRFQLKKLHIYLSSIMNVIFRIFICKFQGCIHINIAADTPHTRLCNEKCSNRVKCVQEFRVVRVLQEGKLWVLFSHRIINVLCYLLHSPTHNKQTFTRNIQCRRGKYRLEKSIGKINFPPRV